MAGKFVVTEGKNGQFYFVLKAANGEVVANSEGYATRAGAHKGAQAVQRAADGATIVDGDT